MHELLATEIDCLRRSARITRMATFKMKQLKRNGNEERDITRN
jgi:Xaa-Pro aminopeptidase